MHPARPEELAPEHLRVANPPLHGQARGLRNLEPDGFAGLALCHRGPILDPTGGVDVVDLETDKVAAPQLAVDGHTKQREVAPVVRHFEPDTDRPDMLRKKRSFLTDNPSLVPRRANTVNHRQIFDGHGFSLIHLAHLVLGLPDETEDSTSPADQIS